MGEENVHLQGTGDSFWYCLWPPGENANFLLILTICSSRNRLEFHS